MDQSSNAFFTNKEGRRSKITKQSCNVFPFCLNLYRLLKTDELFYL